MWHQTFPAQITEAIAWTDGKILDAPCMVYLPEFTHMSGDFVGVINNPKIEDKADTGSTAFGRGH